MINTIDSALSSCWLIWIFAGAFGRHPDCEIAANIRAAFRYPALASVLFRPLAMLIYAHQVPTTGQILVSIFGVAAWWWFGRNDDDNDRYKKWRKRAKEHVQRLGDRLVVTPAPA